jgi:hypothetical protein
MYVEPGWKIEVNLVEKPYEFLMPVAAIATADSDAGNYIHRPKQ